MSPIIGNEFIYEINDLKTAIDKVFDASLDETKRDSVFDEILDSIRSGDLVSWFAGGGEPERKFSNDLSKINGLCSLKDSDLWELLLESVGMSSTAEMSVDYSNMVFLEFAEYLDSDNSYKKVNETDIYVIGINELNLVLHLKSSKPVNDSISIMLKVTKDGSVVEEIRKDMPLNMADKQDVAIPFAFQYNEIDNYLLEILANDSEIGKFAVSGRMSDAETEKLKFESASIFYSNQADPVKCRTSIPYIYPINRISYKFRNNNNKGFVSFTQTVSVDDKVLDTSENTIFIDPEKPTSVIEFPMSVNELMSQNINKDAVLSLNGNGKEMTSLIINNGRLHIDKCQNSFDMIFVEGGSYKMRRTSSRTVEKVSIDSFYISEIPVTNELWNEIVKDNRHDYENNIPVSGISCYDIVKRFIPAINRKTGRKFRLPTEAEWEFAAKGGVRSQNYRYSGSNQIQKAAWYKSNSHDCKHPVSEHKHQNELGICDMSGNVWEICNDETHVDYYYRSEYCKICKGGSYSSPAEECNVRFNKFLACTSSEYATGFRLALDYKHS